MTAQTLNRKEKGDLAELRVAADLVGRGFRVALPFGEDCDFDLLLIRSASVERIQVKYTESDGRVLEVRCTSHSLTNGRVRKTKRYTAEMIDLLAVYDATTDRCYYLPASLLGAGRRVVNLRLQPARNGQKLRIHLATDFVDP